MANSLMFEVGVKRADDQLSEIKKEINALVAQGKSGIDIKVRIVDESNSLRQFLNLLSELGNSKQLTDLKSQVDNLLSSFSKIGLSASNIDMSALKKQLEGIDATYAAIKKKTDDLRAKGNNELNITNQTAGLQAKLDGQLNTLKSKFNLTEEVARQIVNSSKEIDGATKTVVTSLTGEGSAISETVQKFTSLVSEKEQIVNAERKVAETSEKTAKTISDEGKQADKTAESLQNKKKAEEQSANAGSASEDKTIKTEENRLKLLYLIENQLVRIANISNEASGKNLNPFLLGNALGDFKNLFDEFKNGNMSLEAARATFGRLKAEYRDVIVESEKFSKETKRAGDALEKDAAKGAAAAQKENDKWAKSMDIAKTKANELLIAINKLESLKFLGDAWGIDTSKLSTEIGNLKQNLSTLYGMMGGSKINGTAQDFVGSSFFKVPLENAEAYGRIIQKNVQSEQTFLREQQKAEKIRNAASKEEAKSVNDAAVKWEKLGVKIREIQELRNKGAKLGLDVTELNNYIQAIARVRKELYDIVNKNGQYRSSGVTGLPGGLTTAQLIGNIDVQRPFILGQEAVSRFTSKMMEASSSVNQLTADEKRLADAISQSSKEMNGQSQILSDLKMMATQYLSVWGAQSLIHNIIETGGLLEQQRLSIGAILQNAGQATELFDKIKALAIQSPFGVVELDRMSKQLTAYGFEYKELYNWTKRLGDISAATGTGVDRLALALGHVRAEGALSGYTLRQFAMGNVPLLRMLAENLDITTKQVREKVRKKEISYGDVMNVLKQLTDEGGMFYQAQETMSQALNAKFKNLRDAFDIMYNEIAESGVGNALKRIAEILTAGAKEWGRYAKDIMGVVAVLGIAKAAMWAYNAATAAGANTTMLSIARAAKQEQANLRLASSYRTLTATEQQDLVTKNALARSWYGMVAPMKLVTTHQLAVALSTKKLTAEELYRAVALRQLSKAKAENAILDSKLSANLKGQMLLGLQNVKVLGRMQTAMIGFGNALKGVIGIAKGFLPLMAISAVMDLFARTSEMKSQASEASAALAEKATADLKNMSEIFKELQESGFIKNIRAASDKFIGGKRVVSNIFDFNIDELQKHDLTKEIEDLKDKLQDLSPMYEGDLVDIDKMDNQVEQFKAIVKKLESIRHANDVTEAMADVVTDANVNVAGKYSLTRIFGDTYTTDVKDYEDRMKDLAKYVNTINEETIEDIDKTLGGELTKLQKKYSLDSKNSALAMVFAGWSQNGGVPAQFRNKSYVTAIEEQFGKATSGGFLGLGKTLKQQYEQLKADTQEMAETMASIVKNQFEKDPEGAMYAVNNYIKKLMSMARVTDPRVIQEATNMMLAEIRKNLPKNLQGPVIDEMQRKILMEQFMSYIGDTITSSTTPEEAEKALKKYSDMAIKWGEMMNFDMKKIGMDNAEAYRSGLDSKLKAAELKTDWQKRAQKIFSVNTVFTTNIDKNIDQFAQAVQKDLKEKQEYITRNAKHMKALKLPVKVEADVFMDAKKLKALIDKLSWTAFSMAVKGNAKGARALYSKIDDELKPFYNALVGIQESKDWLKSEAYPETDPTKGKKGSGEDKNAKAVRERVRIIKEAADAYQYWREKVGKKGAWVHVQEEFGDVLDDIKVTADNIEDLKGNLDRTLDMDEFKAIKDLKVQREIKKEIAKEKDQIKRKDYEKEAEEFTSKVKLELDSLTRAWEMFNNVREATGNVRLAIELSGAEYGGGTRNFADALKEKIQKDFAELGSKGIEFDINLDDKKIKEQIELAVPKGAEESVAQYEKRISGLVEEYKKWRDLQRDVIKNDIATYTKLIGSAVDYESQLKKIISEMDILIEANDALRGKPGISDEDVDRANEVARLQAYEKAFKATNGYASLMNNSLAMTRDMFLTGINTQMSILEEKFRLNQISAHDFAEEMAKIRKMQEEFNSKGLFGKDNPFTAYLGGGLPNLKNWLESNVKQAEQDFKDTSLSPEQRRQAAQNFNKYNSLLESVNKVTSSLSSLAVVVEISKGVMDGFQQAAQSLSDMFDALGKSDAANTWSDIADTISAISSTLNGSSNVLQNAMSGNVGGTIASVITAPIETITAPITAFAKLHDKKRERQIEELKSEVSKIDNTLNLIKNLRDRELGYDSGNLRRQLAAQYEAQKSSREINTIAGVISVDTNKSATAMYDYYSRGGLTGNGYSQELEALKKQREDYQKMYDLEEDKKKSSSEALEEYKQKMAELDITIMNYAKDLANELYGIDLKGWADQIGDSLMTAFENGEDAAKAFKDTVQDIMRQVLRKMLSLGIIQPMMERLQKKLFGENGQGGVFDATNPEGTIDAAMKEVAAFFGDGGEGQAMIKATQTFYEKWEDLMRSQGLDLSKESTSSTGSSIKSITEQTADILSGYVNSIRADVSVNRAMIAQYFPMYYSAMTSGNAILVNIENHTAAIMRSNDAIRESNAEVRDILKRVTQGGDRVRVS